MIFNARLAKKGRSWLQDEQLQTVMVMAAGTGGHVFPALAVAQSLAQAGYRIVWLGTPAGMEQAKVKEAGFTFHAIPIGGLRGKSIKTLIKAPFYIVRAICKAYCVIQKERPSAVIGFGGYVTGPGGVAAYLSRVPLVIHEQNAILGLTNRLLSGLATRCLEAFPGTFPAKRQAMLTGNPIRSDFLHISPPEVRLKGRQGKARLLVLGGSLGAQILNQIVPEALKALPASLQPEVRHQTGTAHFKSAHNAYADYPAAEVLPFIDDMAAAYADADVVICRAGALTVAEVAAAGVTAIFVPFLYAVDDHQTANAQSLVKNEAAFLVPQTECTAARLQAVLSPLLQDSLLRLKTAQNARNLAVMDATVRVRDSVIFLLEANQ